MRIQVKASFLFLCGFLFASLPLLAVEQVNPRSEAELPAEKTETSDCARFPFGRGCLGFGVGPVISTQNSDFVYGVSAGLSYFVIDRLALGLNGGAVFVKSDKDYSVGPALTYYIGPIAGYMITASVGARKHFLRGSVSAEGWSYGPALGAMTRFFGPAYLGISIGYYTSVFNGYTHSEWSWSPAVFVPF